MNAKMSSGSAATAAGTPPPPPPGAACPSSCCCLANSTIRMAFLLARPTSTIKPICVKMVMSCPASVHADHANRADTSARPGSPPAAASSSRTGPPAPGTRTPPPARTHRSPCSRPGSGGNVSSVQSDAIDRRQLARGDLFHQFDAPVRNWCPAPRRPVIAAAEYMLYRSTIPARWCRESSAPCPAGPSAPGCFAPGAADVADPVAELRIGLDVHLPVPAELVEVVHVVRPEVVLERVEHVVSPSAQRPRTWSGRCPGTAHGVSNRGTVEQPLQPGGLVARRRRSVAHALEFTEPRLPRSSMIILNPPVVPSPRPAGRRRRHRAPRAPPVRHVR